MLDSVNMYACMRLAAQASPSSQPNSLSATTHGLTGSKVEPGSLMEPDAALVVPMAASRWWPPAGTVASRKATAPCCSRVPPAADVLTVLRPSRRPGTEPLDVEEAPVLTIRPGCRYARDGQDASDTAGSSDTGTLQRKQTVGAQADRGL